MLFTICRYNEEPITVQVSTFECLSLDHVNNAYLIIDQDGVVWRNRYGRITSPAKSSHKEIIVGKNAQEAFSYCRKEGLDIKNIAFITQYQDIVGLVDGDMGDRVHFMNSVTEGLFIDVWAYMKSRSRDPKSMVVRAPSIIDIWMR